MILTRPMVDPLPHRPKVWKLYTRLKTVVKVESQVEVLSSPPGILK